MLNSFSLKKKARKKRKKKENASFEAKRDSHKDRRAKGRSDCRIMNEIFVTVSYKLQCRKKFSLLKGERNKENYGSQHP